MGLKHKAKKIKTSEDMISRLPDLLLGRILSYLTTAESVRTSILSKRWSTVWSYVPFLDLDDSLMSHPDPNKQHAIHSSFIQFLNNVFNMPKTDSLEKLTLKCSTFDNLRVNEWVMSAMKCKLKELDLCITENQDFKLGVPLFAYQYLVALKLGKKFDLNLPGKVLLPCLKKLHLHFVQFSNDESCDKLLSGCPVIEYLRMEGVGMGNVATLRVIAPLLKFLSLDYRRNYYSTMYSEHKVVVDAPNLEVLKCDCCYLARSYSFKNLDSLTDAYINVYTELDDEDNINKMREISLQLVTGIANAKAITFTRCTIEVLSFLDSTTLPMFNGLTKLVFVGNNSCGKLLPKFLKNSPFLQDLVLDLRYKYGVSDFEWHDPVQIPQCLLDSLKSVKIWGFDGHNDMLKLIKYMQSNGKVLGELSSGFDKKNHQELKVSKELLSLLLEK